MPYFKYSGQPSSGIIGLTVTSIDKGDPADLTNLRRSEPANGLVPYYLRVNVENLSGTDLSGIYVSGSFRGSLPGGSRASYVAVDEEENFAKCPNVSAPDNFTTKGVTYKTCLVTVAPPASAVVAANWSHELYTSRPVVWK